MRSVVFLLLTVAPSAWATPPTVITDVCDPSDAGPSDKDLCMCVADATRARSEHEEDSSVPLYDNWWDGFTILDDNGAPWGSMGAVAATWVGNGYTYDKSGTCFELDALTNTSVTVALRNEHLQFLARFARDAARSEGARFKVTLTDTDSDGHNDQASNIVFDDVVDIGDAPIFEREPAFCWMIDPDHCEIWGPNSGFMGTVTTNGAQIQGMYLSDRNSDGLPDATIFLSDGRNLILTTASSGSEWTL